MNRTLDVISKAQGSRHRRFAKYHLDGADTIGVIRGEPFAVRFENNYAGRVQVRVSLDGTDVLTGEPATTDAGGRMWIVESGGVLELAAWPESTNGGAAFVFADSGESVAAHTHGDMSQRGTVAVAIFREGYQPPSWPIRTLDDPWWYPRPFQRPVYRGMGIADGPVCSVNSLSSDPGIGAGNYTEQRIGTATGLVSPVLDSILTVRYLWDEELRARLAATPAPATQRPPTGFREAGFIDLRATPRIQTPAVARTPEYRRFA